MHECVSATEKTYIERYDRENFVEGEWTMENGRVGETTGSMTHNNKNNEAREKIEVNYCECLIEVGSEGNGNMLSDSSRKWHQK